MIAHPEIDPWTFTAITASYTYDTAGRVTRVDHGNGTAVIRQYDAADRPTLIRLRYRSLDLARNVAPLTSKRFRYKITKDN